MTSLIHTAERFEQWESLLKEQKVEKLLLLFQESNAIEVADFLSKQETENSLKIINLLPLEYRGEVFEHMEEEHQLSLHALFKPNDLAKVFKYMSSDMRVDFYQKLDDHQKVTLLPYLSKDVRQDVITLSLYPQDTAGGIMSTDFVSLPSDLNVKEALELVRHDAPSNKMIYYIYVVNEDMKMLGFVLLRDLVIADPKTAITEIIKDNFVFAEVREDRESVAQKIEKYDVFALPVLNDMDQLVGIVSHDNAMEVMRKEQTEDMERFMGIMSNERQKDYLSTSGIAHFSKRIAWLIGLFVLSFFSTMIMHRYENLLGLLPILLVYHPIINDAGGNAGSQTATVVIRAFSLGQVTLKNWLWIVWKECKVAFMSSILLAILAFGKVIFFTTFFKNVLKLPLEGAIVFSLTVSLALSLQVFVSTLIGAGLPILFTWGRKDPALAASPAITTIVDATGLLIYFTVAKALMPYSLGG